jgi:hypothetical protein
MRSFLVIVVAVLSFGMLTTGCKNKTDNNTAPNISTNPPISDTNPPKREGVKDKTKAGAPLPQPPTK